MKKKGLLFAQDGSINRIMSMAADLVILNILTILFSVPILTAGTSVTACYRCVFKLREHKESYIWKDFFRSFKENFRQATVLWLMDLLVILMMYENMNIAESLVSFGDVLQILSMAVCLLLLLTASIKYPMQALYVNPLKQTIIGAVQLALGNPLQTLAVGMVNGIIVYLLTHFTAAWGVFFLLGISGSAWINSFALKAVFRQISIEEKGEAVDGTKQREDND